MTTTFGSNLVEFNDFNIENMKDFDFSGKHDVSGPRNPDSYQVLMEYGYPDANNKLEYSRLRVEMPRFNTYKGIQDHKQFVGKPAIAVRFDMKNPEHVAFVGEFGTLYEYNRRGQHLSDEPKPSTGVLSQLYDWSVRQYGRHLAKMDGRNPDDADDADYFEATKHVTKDMFYYRRKYTAADEKAGKGKKGEIIPGADPMKFFKLLAYTEMNDDGTQKPTKYTNFLMPNGEKIDMRYLYDKSFDFTGVLSFRRIYIGARKSVTMELTDVLINQFHVTEQGLSRTANHLLTKNAKANPEEADLVARQFAEMRGLAEGTANTEEDTHDKPQFADVDVDETKEEHDEEAPGEIPEETPEDAPESSPKDHDKKRRRARDDDSEDEKPTRRRRRDRTEDQEAD